MRKSEPRPMTVGRSAAGPFQPGNRLGRARLAGAARASGSSGPAANWGVADVVVALGAVADAMAAGELTPDEACAVAGVLKVHRRAVEAVDLDVRLRRLEQTLGTAR